MKTNVQIRTRKIGKVWRLFSFTHGAGENPLGPLVLTAKDCPVDRVEFQYKDQAQTASKRLEAWINKEYSKSKIGKRNQELMRKYSEAMKGKEPDGFND